MLLTIWDTLFFYPVYNGLVFFIDAIPGGDIGLAIVCITVLVKVILLPLSIKAVRTQKIMRDIDPKMKEIKERLKDKREEQAQEIMLLYKEAGLNPFSSIFLMFLQIPIIIALYFSVSRGGGVTFPDINIDILYSFIPTPEKVDMMFLGFVDMAGKSLPLAILAGVTQFIYARLSITPPEPKKDPNKTDFKADFAHTMHLQMRYVLPVIIGVVAYTISAAVALYFTVSNLMMIAQEFVVRRHR